MTQTALIVVAAGSGQRFSAEIDKPFVDLEGKPLVWHCLAGLDEPDLFAQRLVVVAPTMRDRFQNDVLAKHSLRHAVEVIAGG